MLSSHRPTWGDKTVEFRRVGGVNWIRDNSRLPPTENWKPNMFRILVFEDRRVYTVARPPRRTPPGRPQADLGSSCVAIIWPIAIFFYIPADCRRLH